MEKLEKHIKNKLEERKISPSKDAWQQIASSLGDTNEKKNKATYWYAIAASVIGLLIVSVVYFNSQESIEPSIKIVDAENTQKSNQKNIEQTGIVVVDKEEKAIQVAKQNDGINTKTDFVEKISTKSDTRIAIVEPLNKEEKVVQDTFVNSNVEDLIINEKVEEVLAKVMSLESMASQVTEAEIDSLLRSAQQEVIKERLFQEDGKVDAMALLNEVETELDQSFRNKIFTKLKQGFFKARTAIADRNN